jgi:prepilin-type processing-associated H-X9-DG protein
MADGPIAESPIPTPPAKMSRIAILSAILAAIAVACILLENLLDHVAPFTMLPRWGWWAPPAAIILSVVAFRRVPLRKGVLTLTRQNWSALIGLVLGLFTLPASCVYIRTPYEGQWLSCRSNLKQIGLAIGMYQYDNADQMPPDLQELRYRHYINDAKILLCPAVSTAEIDYSVPGADVSYYYARPAVRADSLVPALPIVWEKKQWHGGRGGNVLYSDLHVEPVELDKLKRQINERPALYFSPPQLPEE